MTDTFGFGRCANSIHFRYRVASKSYGKTVLASAGSGALLSVIMEDPGLLEGEPIAEKGIGMTKYGGKMKDAAGCVQLFICKKFKEKVYVRVDMGERLVA